MFFRLVHFIDVDLDDVWALRNFLTKLFKFGVAVSHADFECVKLKRWTYTFNLTHSRELENVLYQDKFKNCHSPQLTFDRIIPDWFETRGFVYCLQLLEYRCNQCILLLPFVHSKHVSGWAGLTEEVFRWFYSELIGFRDYRAVAYPCFFRVM